MNHANMPEAAVKNIAQDDDDRLEAVMGGASTLGPCLTLVIDSDGKGLSGEGSAVMY